jgi:hypothetical protein
MRVSGLGWYGDRYTYRKWDVKVEQRNGKWVSTLSKGSKSYGVIARDQQSALELARLIIDRKEYAQSLSKSDRGKFENLHQIMSWFTTEPHLPKLNRAYLAREIEDYRRGERADWQEECEGRTYLDTDCIDTQNTLKAFEFFDALPLQDRVRWLDGMVKEAKLSALHDTNPRRKPRRKKSNPDRAAFRRMMRL